MIPSKTKNASHREEQNHVTNQTAYALRVYGAAAAAATADGSDHGGSAEHLQPLRLHAAGHARHRSRRRAVGQGRRRDGKADLPLPEGRQRSGPALRSDRPAGKIRRAALRRTGFPLPPLPDRQGLPRRTRAARPLPRVLPGRYRHHRRRQAFHHERGRDSVYHLQDVFDARPAPVPDSRE